MTTFRGHKTQIIAISTYNRKAEVVACLECLEAARGIENWRVIIHDDASSDFDIAAITSHLPFECSVFRNPVNLGGDENNVTMLKACVDQGASRIFLLDSDMIVSTDVFEFIENVFERTQGVLSVYNSILHAEASMIDADLVAKQSIGAAATIWDANLLHTVLDKLDGFQIFDWQFCRILDQQKVQLCVAKQSRAQHIGINGDHTAEFGQLEYGIGFSVETAEQARALAMAHANLMLSQNVRPLSSPDAQVPGSNKSADKFPHSFFMAREISKLISKKS